MSDEITWENTISGYMTFMEIGAMRSKSYIKPLLDLGNYESVVLHAHGGEKAKELFENDAVIYPEAIRGEDDFSWGDKGIIARVALDAPVGDQMPPGEAAKWPKEWVDNFNHWMDNDYPKG
jgi:hypothetical protein